MNYHVQQLHFRFTSDDDVVAEDITDQDETEEFHSSEARL